MGAQNVEELTLYFNNIVLSDTTIKKRKSIKSLLDSYTTFSWRGYDSFDSFGAFIITNKKGLTFDNGPTFTNEYSTPQFDSHAGQLLGMKFNHRSITFTVAVYWITLKHYRQFLNWLNPYEIDTLAFSFDSNYRYNVKLAKIGEGERRIIGYDHGEDAYYAEVQLTFELQGEPFAIMQRPYEYTPEYTMIPLTDRPKKVVFHYNNQDNLPYSDLSFPFVLSWKTILFGNIEKDKLSVDYKGIIRDTLNNTEWELFRFTIVNASYANMYDLTCSGNIMCSDTLLIGGYSDADNSLYFRYDSALGLVFIEGTEDLTLLSLLNTTSSGARLISNIQAIKMQIPGNFVMSDFNHNRYEIRLEVTNDEDNTQCTVENALLTAYGRTNII